MLARRQIPAWAALLPCVLLAGCGIQARHLIEKTALTTGPNGTDTPAVFGVPFEQVAISSGSRHLDSYVVAASPACANPPVVVIYHGMKETISDWARAQGFLYDHCVSSVIFDYTGSGNSSRPARFEYVAEDSIAAYEFTQKRFPGRHVYVLGHSMGNGPMLAAVPHFSSQPAGVILANTFSSLQQVGSRSKYFLYRTLRHTVPDWWDNVKSVRAIHVPLLVLHSDADKTIPIADGRVVFAAANQPKILTILHGYSHNALHAQPSEAWWSSVLEFVHAPRPAIASVNGQASPRAFAENYLSKAHN
jgi:alpha-beta hydrolase superfamily lysophospholipase